MGPGNKVGPDIKVGPGNKVGPGIRVGPRLNLKWSPRTRWAPVQSYAFICIRHESVCTHMPPHASFTPPNANIQHTSLQDRAEVTSSEVGGRGWGGGGDRLGGDINWEEDKEE